MEHLKLRLKWLFNRYLNNTCTSEERKEFLQLVVDPENQAEIKQLLESAIEAAEADRQIENNKADQLFADILRSSGEKDVTINHKKKKYFSFSKIAMAASITFILGIALFWMVSSYKWQPPVAMHHVKTSTPLILPGHNNALLTLADGSTVTLDSVGNGALTQQGNMKVIKIGDQLKYTGKKGTSEVIYNTVSTGKGNQYQLVLSDGTKIWLNASSSLRFPVAFTGNQRRVDMTGEVYFEVTHNVASPFSVFVNGMEITVLGTRFNVSAYADEKEISTTLLEGAVKLTKENASGILKPGQQAHLDESGVFKFNNGIDVEEVVAWKNGTFIFNGQHIESIMRQVSRWYDIEVAYQGTISKETFSGVVSRKSNLPEVLKIMEAGGGVNFKIEGRKIIVMQ